MDNKKNIQENESDSRLKEIFGAKNPFEVPEGYFDTVADRALENIRDGKGKRIFLNQGTRNFAAAAAILLLGILASVYLFNGKENIDESLQDISMSDLYMYNINNLAEIEETYLMSLLDMDSLDFQNVIAPDTTDISDDVIKEYLLAENHIEYLLISEY